MSGNSRNAPSTSRGFTSQRSGQEKCTSKSCNCILRALRRAEEYLQESKKVEEKQQLEKQHEDLKVKYQYLKQRYGSLKRQHQILDLQRREDRNTDKSTKIVIASSSSDLQEEDNKEDTDDDREESDEEIEVIRNNNSVAVAGPSKKRKAQLAVEYQESSRGKALKVLSETTEEETNGMSRVLFTEADMPNNMSLMKVINFAQQRARQRNAAQTESRWSLE